MSPARQPTNVAASVRARLLELSRRRKVEFQQILSEFAIERLLYRLGVSPYAERFVLKGAMLFKVWSDGSHRATWDLDLLGRGVSAVPEVVAVIRDLCMIPVGDGIVFDEASIEGEEIRAADEYAGVRVRLEARLAEALIPMQVDVGFGDVIVPDPSRRSYPTLLDHPPPLILVYPLEGEFPLIGRQGALCGCVNFASGRFWASEHAVVAAPRVEGHPQWLGYLLRAMSLNSYSESAAQPGLAVDTISALPVPTPAVSEQRAIAAFLDRATAKIDTLAAKVRNAIDHLKELRTALISAAVTGKIDVREEAA